MQPQMLLDYIRGNPDELKLFETIRFRRRTRSNPCDFNDILQALKANSSIQTIICSRFFVSGISSAEWFRFVQTLGRIVSLEELYFVCNSQVPALALADAISTSRSLRKLFFGHENTLVGDPADLEELVTASESFRHSTLEELVWMGGADRDESEQHVVSFDAWLQALIPCPHLRTAKIFSERVPENSLRDLIRCVTNLHLLATLDEWLVVVDEIRNHNTGLQELVLSSHLSSTDTDTAIVGLAQAVKHDQHLQRLRLEMCNGYTDKAGVALAEAVQINTTLRLVDLDENGSCGEASGDTRNSMGFSAYKAFTTMVVARSDHLELGVPAADKGASIADKDQYDKMRIELRLNAVGRRQLLATSPTTRDAWVNALLELNSDEENCDIKVDCLYTFLLLNPTVCQLHGATDF
jgi:hypothetical protein